MIFTSESSIKRKYSSKVEISQSCTPVKEVNVCSYFPPDNGYLHFKIETFGHTIRG